MINMENREEILKKHTELNKIQLTNPHYTVGGIKNGIKTSGTFVLFEDVPHAMQEYSDQQNKSLLDEIEMLKFQLKAADSVNENLSKMHNEILETLNFYDFEDYEKINSIKNTLNQLHNQPK